MSQNSTWNKVTRLIDNDSEIWHNKIFPRLVPFGNQINKSKFRLVLVHNILIFENGPIILEELQVIVLPRQNILKFPTGLVGEKLFSYCVCMV